MSDWGILETFITHPPYITVGIQASSWPHAEDKIRPLIRTVCCKGWTTSIFSSWGKSHTRLFSAVSAAAQPAVCAYRPPPTGRLCARPVGGGPVRRLLCLPLSSSCGVARWQGDVVRYHYKMFICVHSCKDTLSFSYRSLSLPSSSVDRCVVE